MDRSSFIIKITSSKNGSAIFLKPLCPQIGCVGTVYAKYGSIPFTNNFHQRLNFYSNSTNHTLFMVKPSKYSRNVFLRILLNLTANGTELSSNETTQFVLEVFTTSCLFWKEETNRWSSVGCQVGRLVFL